MQSLHHIAASSPLHFQWISTHLRYRWKFGWINLQHYLCSSIWVFLDLAFILFFNSRKSPNSFLMLLYTAAAGKGSIWENKLGRGGNPLSSHKRSSRCPRAHSLSLHTASTLCKAETASRRTHLVSDCCSKLTLIYKHCRLAFAGRGSRIQPQPTAGMERHQRARAEGQVNDFIYSCLSCAADFLRGWSYRYGY